jgi:hypothetical protein
MLLKYQGLILCALIIRLFSIKLGASRVEEAVLALGELVGSFYIAVIRH